jgi:hypothetical protein
MFDAPHIEVQAPAECAPFSRVLAGLRLKFREAPFLRGVTPKGTMMILTLNPSTSTWTLIEVMPDMTACIRADGNGMEPVPFVPDGTDS